MVVAIRADLAQDINMEAVVFNGKELTLKYVKDFPIPKIVNDTDVIVKVEYSGICGTDVHIIQGEFPASKERPLAMGHEFSGIITQVGKASVFKVGQKVVVDPNSACHICDHCRSGNYHYCLTAGINSTIGIWRDGGWAEYVLCPQNNVFTLPDDITTEQEAASGRAAASLRGRASGDAAKGTAQTEAPLSTAKKPTKYGSARCARLRLL
ncbi:hypothetical protein MSG28_015434 [Choristoneura fumiferana]|uniref:Uncharacterized protein n=1 Tax=Choristoneura fumiferana TaxID=7141 RepID=A0ACC0KAD9_CHOFU|nr:hypothetical protein MSG28_015434 [Choristoneura fumiferana]